MLQLVFALRLTFELSKVGGVTATADSDVGIYFQDGYKELAYRIILSAFYLYYLLQELTELWHEGARHYFTGREAWRNWIQIINIVLFVIQIFVETAGLNVTPGMGDSTWHAGELELHGARFNDFVPVVAAARRARQMLAWNNVINWFKLILFMAYVSARRRIRVLRGGGGGRITTTCAAPRFIIHTWAEEGWSHHHVPRRIPRANKTRSHTTRRRRRYAPIFGLLIETLDLAAPLMCSFMFVLIPVFCGFSFAHQLVFGHAVANFASETQSTLTLIRALLGDFDFGEMYTVDGAMAMCLFLSFIMLLVFFILNMVIAIISESYEEAKNKMLAKDNVNIFRELLDFVVYRAEVCCCFLCVTAVELLFECRASDDAASFGTEPKRVPRLAGCRTSAAQGGRVGGDHRS